MRGLIFFRNLQKVGSGVLIFSPAALFLITEIDQKHRFLGAKPQNFRALRARGAENFRLRRISKTGS